MYTLNNNNNNKEFLPKETSSADKQMPCTDRSHNPPTHLYVPSGQKYTHRCPRCGKTFDIWGSGAIY